MNFEQHVEEIKIDLQDYIENENSTDEDFKKIFNKIFLI